MEERVIVQDHRDLSLYMVSNEPRYRMILTGSALWGDIDPLTLGKGDTLILCVTKYGEVLGIRREDINRVEVVNET